MAALEAAAVVVVGGGTAVEGRPTAVLVRAAVGSCTAATATVAAGWCMEEAATAAGARQSADIHMSKALDCRVASALRSS